MKLQNKSAKVGTNHPIGGVTGSGLMGRKGSAMISSLERRREGGPKAGKNRMGGSIVKVEMTIPTSHSA